jgi:type I restriction enzyme S subunit
MTEGFPKVPLGEVAEINPRRPEIRREGSTPTTFVPMQAISETLGIIDKAEVRPFEKVAKGYTYFETGDVLFAKITPCMQNGKHAIAENLIDGMGFGTTEFHVLRPGQKLRPEWLLHYLRQDDVLQSAERAFTGSVGLQRIPDSYLEKLEIPLPTVETQDARLNTIRQVLKQSRLAIDGIEYQKDHAAHLVSALLRSAFGNTSPILAGNQPSSIADWTVRPLLDLARLESGHTPSRRRPEWWGGDVPWLALPDIRKLHGRWRLRDNRDHQRRRPGSIRRRAAASRARYASAAMRRSVRHDAWQTHGDQPALLQLDLQSGEARSRVPHVCLHGLPSTTCVSLEVVRY